jgi:hypothetical protein
MATIIEHAIGDDFSCLGILNRLLHVDCGKHYHADGLISPLTFNKICIHKITHQILGSIIKMILVPELKNRK